MWVVPSWAGVYSTPSVLRCATGDKFVDYLLMNVNSEWVKVIFITTCTMRCSIARQSQAEPSVGVQEHHPPRAVWAPRQEHHRTELTREILVCHSKKLYWFLFLISGYCPLPSPRLPPSWEKKRRCTQPRASWHGTPHVHGNGRLWSPQASPGNVLPRFFSA